MSFSAALLREWLAEHTPAAATGLVVALSGGADSAALLTAVAQLDPPLRGLSVRAVHVDHGLQAAAADFRRSCEALCRTLGIPLAVIEVTVEAPSGVSLEAAARDARYAGLARDFKAGECLVTAHHAEDQAETLLLQLLRGAGLKGMSAMPLCRPWQGGWHVRPLLGVTQAELRRFAAQAGVSSAHDPMNDDPRFDRVYLRRQVWPLIEARWPGAATALARGARHLAEGQDLLDQAAAKSVSALRDGDTLSVTGLRRLCATEQVNALRYWIDAGGVPLPSTARLTEALRQMLSADTDQLPAVVWGDHALRRYRDRLFLTRAHPPVLSEPREWQVASGKSLALSHGAGTLHWEPQRGGLDASRLPPALSVRPRRGGETLKPHSRAATQTVQHLCQSLGVLPWMRNALPMIYAGQELIAVGDMWLDARWCVPATEPGFACRWQDAPILV
jgi:tRNA(Ile)-lysidine synthase